MLLTNPRQLAPAKAFTAESLKYLGGIIAPKVASHDVTYLPDSYPPAGISADALNMGGRPFALDLVRREFVLGTRYGRVVRMQMVEPAEHTDGTPNTFPTAPYVTPVMVDVSGQSTTEPNPPSINKSWFETCVPYDTANTSLGGFLPLGDEILIAGQVYYDANNIQRYSAALSEWPALPPAADYRPNRTPFRSIGDPGSQGLVSGYMAPVPEAWRERLKGDVLMGQAGLPIISRGSAGPCATSFRASDVREKQPVPTTLLVGYPQGHWMPGHPWDNPNADDVYNFATIIVGCAIVGDNIVFVGSHGYGAPCYGDGTSDPDAADGVHVCYDPASSSKSNHAYPYRLQLWHYPLSELARVAAGEIEPWSMVPDWFELTVPFKQLTHQCNGCAFDPETNRLYVSMFAADGYGYEPGPIIYAWEFTGGGAEPPDPPDPDQDEQIKKLQKTVLALTAALAKERQAHAVLKATVHAEAVTIADADVRILKATSPEKK